MCPENENRLEALQKSMRTAGIDAFLISSTVHLFYMTERVLDGYLYVPAAGKGVLLVRRPVLPTLPEAVYFKSPKQLPSLLCDRGLPLPRRLALEDCELTHADFTATAGLFAKSEVVEGSFLLHRLRMIKSDHEIELLREGARAHEAVYEYIPRLYRDGMTDWELTAEVDRYVRLTGHLGIMRCAGTKMEACASLVLSGDNAGTPSPYDFSLPGGGRHPSAPLGADGRVLQPGDTVSVDFCGNINGYLTDITRTYAVGFIRPEAAESHRLSMSILREMERIVHPGVLCSELFHRAWEMAKAAGYGDRFMGQAQQAKFIGHGIGLQVNELPVLTKNDHTPLAPGMVIAIEPKLVCPGVGPTGIENTYLVTRVGLEKLTHATEDILLMGD